MRSKTFASAFVCLLIPIVLAAPVDDKDGGVQSKQEPANVQQAQSQQINHNAGENVENSEQASQDGSPQIKENIPPPPNPVRAESSPEELGKAMDELTAEDIIRDVLITIRDHPEIMKELIEDKEKEIDKELESAESTEADDDADDHDSAFERPPPQLLQMPKMVQKKSDYDWRKHLKDTSESVSESDEVPNKYDRFRDDSKSGEVSSKYNWYQHISDDNSQHSSSSSSEDSESSESESSAESNEVKPSEQFAMKKRVPELPEQTIDLTSLPEGGDDKRSKGFKNVYKALPKPGKFRDPRHKNKATPLLENDPFIKSIPIFKADDFHSEKTNTPEKNTQNVHVKLDKTPIQDQKQTLPEKKEQVNLEPAPHPHKWQIVNQRNYRNHQKHADDNENELMALTKQKDKEA